MLEPSGGPRVAVDAHATEVMGEASLHRDTRGVLERFAGCAQHVVHDR